MKKYIEAITALIIGLVAVVVATSLIVVIQNRYRVQEPKVIYTDNYKKVYGEGFNDGVSQQICLHFDKGAAYSHSEPPYFTWDDCVTPEEAAESGFSHALGSMPMP
jgi:hypothetical protein